MRALSIWRQEFGEYSIDGAGQVADILARDFGTALRRHIAVEALLLLQKKKKDRKQQSS